MRALTRPAGQIVINGIAVPQGGNVNWNDIGYKVFWTVVASIAGLVPVVAADWPTWLAPPLIGLANLLLAYARQKVDAKRAATTTAAVLAILALAVGVLGVLGVASPAESSTAHSISYHCAISRPAGHTVIGASAWTVVNGVVMVDKCRSNNLSILGDADRCWTIYETTHNRSGYWVC